MLSVQCKMLIVTTSVPVAVFSSEPLQNHVPSVVGLSLFVTKVGSIKYSLLSSCGFVVYSALDLSSRGVVQCCLLLICARGFQGTSSLD